ncbi:MAG: BMP family ABC transporter substrate-binding protein [Spirochaetaceae bacterium]|jgi:basic membrane protein A|nr:BMP family ABC transporter substrate-binding protein [Spirochaetaceae bacterium]
MKMKAKTAAVCILLLGMVFAGCAKKEQPKETAGTAPGTKPAIRVALIVTGMLGDKSFNDSMYAGLERARNEFGIEVKALESKETSDWEANLIAMAAEGYDLVIVPSQLTDSVIALAPKYPGVNFGVIDAVVDAPNVQSAIFSQNEGAFLVGVAAAMFTTKTNIENVNDKKIVGFIAGMDIPVIADFFAGYEQGVKYIDPEIRVLASYCGTFNDPLKGKELAEAQYSQGADIIYNLGATSGEGILETANTLGLYAIGGDINQDGIYPGRILTSELKMNDTATYLMAKAVVDGTFKGGSIRLDVANGGMGVTDMSVMRKALGDKFPEDIPEKINELIRDITDGTLAVNHAPGF